MMMEIARMQKDIQRQHEALLVLLNSNQDLVDLERSSLVSAIYLSLNHPVSLFVVRLRAASPAGTAAGLTIFFTVLKPPS